MPQAAPPDIALLLLDEPNLRRLAAARPMDLDGALVFEGSLPPTHVAVRALAQLEAGTPAPWCVPYLIASGADARLAILGGCRFKSAPVDGCVEIGYGVAASQRGRGIASAAVGRMLQFAATSGMVRQVVAHIVPDNIASAAVVSRLGFSRGESLLDTDGETVVRWTRCID